jgi:membrane-associated protease RseP (regulator of RpoE activity)
MVISVLKKIRSITIALIGLNSVITIHELGHWTFCKMFGVYTPTFSIGFGPPLLTKVLYSTKFILAALPIGGYVSIAHLTSTTPAWFIPYVFDAKPFYQQALILLGGILFNIAFALIIFLLFRPKYSITKSTDQKRYSFVGPLGIISLLSTLAEKDIVSFMRAIGLLSANLALINLIPLPILDGGQLLFYSFYAATGYFPSNNLINILNTLCSGALLLFLAYLSFNDFRRIVKNN